MRVAVIGLGYVGLVQTAALLRDGHQVCGIDNNDRIRARLSRGEVPYREPGVADLIAAGHADGRLTVTARIQDQADADLVFVCVGTEGLADGTLDLSSVIAVACELGAAARLRPPGLPPLLLVLRCTMLPGSMRDHVLPAIHDAAGEPPGARYDIVYHPEFTREGSALADYLAPARLVIGESRPGAARVLRHLLAGIDAPVFTTSFEVAELTKLADNSFHALKVGFANEIGRLAVSSGIPPDAVFDIFTADTKLNLSAAYLRPGPAFGGPCLPKDVRALAARAQAIDVAAPIIDHILASNTSHTAFLMAEIERRTAPRSRILLLGLTYKHGTDDLRHSPFVRLAEMILVRGHDLAIHDPDVAADDDAETITRLAPQLVRRIVPRAAITSHWDLVVVGKDIPEVLRSLPDTVPLFTVNRL